jgi:hypothetical protein
MESKVLEAGAQQVTKCVPDLYRTVAHLYEKKYDAKLYGGYQSGVRRT